MYHPEHFPMDDGSAIFTRSISFSPLGVNTLLNRLQLNNLCTTKMYAYSFSIKNVCLKKIMITSLSLSSATEFHSNQHKLR